MTGINSAFGSIQNNFGQTENFILYTTACVLSFGRLQVFIEIVTGTRSLTTTAMDTGVIVFLIRPDRFGTDGISDIMNSRTTVDLFVFPEGGTNTLIVNDRYVETRIPVPIRIRNLIENRIFRIKIRFQMRIIPVRQRQIDNRITFQGSTAVVFYIFILIDQFLRRRQSALIISLETDSVDKPHITAGATILPNRLLIVRIRIITQC